MTPPKRCTIFLFCPTFWTKGQTYTFLMGLIIYVAGTDKKAYKLVVVI